MDYLLISITKTELKELMKESVSELLAESHSQVSSGHNANIREDLVSRKELETLLGVCHSTVSARVKDGTLKPIRVGRRQFFRLSELPKNIGNGGKE